MKFAPILDVDWQYMDAALACARQSLSSGGIPVGAVLVRAGSLLGQGCNRSLQTNDPTSHAEIDCLRSAGHLDSYADATLYTTLSPCHMCAGAAVFLGISRLVIGERQNYAGELEPLHAQGIEVTVLDHQGCVRLLSEYVNANPILWNKLTS
jgi:cytosine deaminase